MCGCARAHTRIHLSLSFFFFFLEVGSHTGWQLSLTASPPMVHRDRMVFTAAWKKAHMYPSSG